MTEALQRSPDVSGVILDENGVLRVVSRAFVNATTSGNTSIVSTQGDGVRIRVLSLTIVAAAAVTVKFQSATTDIAPGFSFAANGGVAIPNNQHGLFQTAQNEALNINLSTNANVGCLITWCKAY